MRKIFLLLALAAMPAYLDAAYALVSGTATASSQQASGGTVLFNLLKPPGAGNIGLACLGSPAATTPQITALSGGGFASTAVIGRSNTNSDTECWIGYNASGSGGMQLAFSVTGSGFWRFRYSEWSGGPTSAAVDGSAVASTGSGSSATITTGNLTPTAALAELVYAFEVNTANQTLSSGPTNSFVATATGGDGRAEAAYQIVASTSGSYSTAWTFSTNTTADALIFSLEAATTAAHVVHRAISQ